MACARHRQVRLASLAAAKHTPRNGNKNNAENQTERRGGAEPSPLNRFGDRLPLFPPRRAFFHWFLPFIAPLEFAFSVGYGSIVPRASQRPQNRRLKHLYKRIESRVRIVSLLGSFAVYEAFPDLYATILPLSR